MPSAVAVPMFAREPPGKRFHFGLRAARNRPPGCGEWRAIGECRTVEVGRPAAPRLTGEKHPPTIPSLHDARVSELDSVRAQRGVARIKYFDLRALRKFVHSRPSQCAPVVAPVCDAAPA